MRFLKTKRNKIKPTNIEIQNKIKHRIDTETTHFNTHTHMCMYIQHGTKLYEKYLWRLRMITLSNYFCFLGSEEFCIGLSLMDLVVVVMIYFSHKCFNVLRNNFPSCLSKSSYTTPAAPGLSPFLCLPFSIYCIVVMNIIQLINARQKQVK